MSIRLHATAIWGGVAEEVRAVYREILGPGFDAVELHEAGEWVWFTTSVWAVNGGDLNKGLCQIAKPAVQITASDGSRWYMTVHGGPEGARSFLHEFWMFQGSFDPGADEERAAEAQQSQREAVDPDLAFLEEDAPDEPARPRTAFDDVAEDFAEWGATLPETFVEEVRELPYSAAMNRLREWQAGELPEHLKRAGMAIDGAAVRRVLLWENVRPIECESDLGNLPRLLATLGLDGEWDEHVRQAEAPEPERESELAEEGGEDGGGGAAGPAELNHWSEVSGRVSGLALEPIQGGLVPVEPKELIRLGFGSEACSTWASPRTAVRLTLPESHKRRLARMPLPSEPREEVQGEVEESSIRIGLQNRNWFGKRDLTEGLGASLTRLVLKPPEGGVIEVDFAVDEEPATHHRFRGEVREGKCWIEASYPRLTHEALAGAITIAGFEGKSRIRCRDETEARALAAAAQRDYDLHDMGVKRRGLTVSVEFDTGKLAKLLLRLRYPDVWDFGPVMAHEAREYQERIEQTKQFRRAASAAARKRAAPRVGEVLYKGKHSWYWRSDFAQLEPLDQEARERFDAAMTALGFTFVGDLVAKKQRDIVVRVYLSADRKSYGILMGKRTMYMGQEYVSRIEDGSGLTTTTNMAAGSDAKASIYIRIFSGLDPGALYAKHVEGLERFRTRKGLEAVDLERTLGGVAREIERAFARRERSEARLAVIEAEETGQE